MKLGSSCQPLRCARATSTGQNICFLLQIGQGLGFGCSAGPGNAVKFRGSLANQVDRARSSSKIVGMDEAQQIATS